MKQKHCGVRAVGGDNCIMYHDIAWYMLRMPRGIIGAGAIDLFDTE
jgi:hypothetical protein